MKKAYLLLFIFIFIGLVGCKNKTENVFDKLNDAENLTMVISMNVPVFGEIEITTMIDGDKEYVNTFIGEYYISTENGVKYKYSKNLYDNWIKEEDTAEEPEKTTGEDIDPTKFKESWFEKDDGKYILKSEYYDEVFGEEATDVRLFELLIEDEEFTINFKINSDGFLVTGSILVKDIGKTNVNLPVINQEDN